MSLQLPRRLCLFATIVAGCLLSQPDLSAADNNILFRSRGTAAHVGYGPSAGRPVLFLPASQYQHYQRPIIYLRPNPVVLRVTPPRRLHSARQTPYPATSSSYRFAPPISRRLYAPPQHAAHYAPPAVRSAGHSFNVPAEAVTSAANPPVIHYAVPRAGIAVIFGVPGTQVGSVLQPQPAQKPGTHADATAPKTRTFESNDAAKRDDSDKRNSASNLPDVVAKKSGDLTIPLTPGPTPDQPRPKSPSTPDQPQKEKTEDAAQNDAHATAATEPEKPKAATRSKSKPQSKRQKPKASKPRKQKSPELSTPVLAWNLPDSLRSRDNRHIASHEIASRDKIRIDTHNGLDLREGWVQFPISSGNLLKGIQKSKQFLVVANVTCGNEKQTGPARILSCSKDSDARNFTLAQDGRKFVFRIRSGSDDVNGTKHETSFGRVRPGKQQQVAVRYDGRELECYVDGELVAERKFKTDFRSWERFAVVAGNEFTADRPWAGTIHSLAVLPTADRAQLKEFFRQK